MSELIILSSLSTAFCIIMFLTAAVFIRVEFHKTRIRHQINQLGGQIYIIKLSEYDKHSLTFDVRYSDRSGVVHKGRCRVDQNSQLNWNQRPAEVLVPSTPVRQAMVERLSSKEQIITDLAAENERLRAELLSWQTNNSY